MVGFDGLIPRTGVVVVWFAGSLLVFLLVAAVVVRVVAVVPWIGCSLVLGGFVALVAGCALETLVSLGSVVLSHCWSWLLVPGMVNGFLESKSDCRGHSALSIVWFQLVLAGKSHCSVLICKVFCFFTIRIEKCNLKL